MFLAEYEEIIRHAKQVYADELIRSEEVSGGDKAFQRSSSEIDGLLPNGVKTDGHHFYIIEMDGLAVGYLWFRVSSKEAGSMHLCFIFVEKRYRQKGCASSAINFLNQFSKENDIDQIGLLVFKDNWPAINLYKKHGYHIVKELSLNGARKTTRFQMKKVA